MVNQGRILKEMTANNGFGPIPWKNDYQYYSYLNSFEWIWTKPTYARRVLSWNWINTNLMDLMYLNTGCEMSWIEEKKSGFPTQSSVLIWWDSETHNLGKSNTFTLLFWKCCLFWAEAHFTTWIYIQKTEIAQTEAVFHKLRKTDKPNLTHVPCYGMSTPTNNWAYRHLENKRRQPCTRPFILCLLPNWEWNQLK